VAQVGGQERQECLHVGALAVPSDEPMDGHGVTKVVQTRLPAGFGGALDAGVSPQANEDFLQLLEGNRVTGPGREEGGARFVRHRQASPGCLVGLERPDEIGADRHQAGLEELGVPDGEGAFAEIHVTAAQTQALPGT